MLRVLATGDPPVRRGGMPQRIDAIFRSASVCRESQELDRLETRPLLRVAHNQYQ